MSSFEFPISAGALGAQFGASVLGDPTLEISRLSSLEKAGKGALCFFADPKYAAQLNAAEGAVVLTKPELVRSDLDLTYVLVSDPKSSFAKIALHLRPAFPWRGISEQAVVSPSARIHPSASVGPFAVIGEGVEIGQGSRVYPHAYLGKEVRIGSDCEIHPRAVLYDGVRLGDRVKVFAGAVLGSDGFGYFREGDQGPYQEMPQVGAVVVEDDVRIGANTAIDRATLTETKIGRGTKIDNLVHVGHNTVIGKDCILCAQVGMGGSGTLEDDVALGGQVGLGHGVNVGSGARMGGQSGSTTNVPGKETYFFTPATPVREFARLWRAIRKLPHTAKRLKEIEEFMGKGNGGSGAD